MVDIRLLVFWAARINCKRGTLRQLSVETVGIEPTEGSRRKEH